MALSLHCVKNKNKNLYKFVVPTATMDKADYKFEPHLFVGVLSPSFTVYCPRNNLLKHGEKTRKSTTKIDWSWD